jgi:hypothetical protein
MNHFNEVSGIPDYNGRYREGYDLADIPSRFVPSSVVITRKGECAIFVSDDAEEHGENDDWDEGFVITTVPEIRIHSKEEYQVCPVAGVCEQGHHRVLNGKN